MENQQEKDHNNQKAETNNDVQELNDIQEEISDDQISQNYIAEIADLTNQIAVAQDKLLRTVAESENTRKRLEKSIEDARDYAIVSFAKDLLVVSDNLSRALEHKPKNIEGEVASIITGVEMTKSDLTNVLKKHGVESIEPLLGEKFDYNIHHAISQVTSDEHDADIIMAIMQSGYKIKNRLLRPAIVQVSKKSM